jgi:heme exporter protein C
MLLASMAMFAFAPIYIAWAPYQDTMLLIQKIFYFHVPSAFAMFTAAFVCGIASARFLAKKRPESDRTALAAAELAVLFGSIVLVSGPIWARKAWGVWWMWDAHQTISLLTWMIFTAYLLLRKFGGPGAETLCAGMGLFGMANVPFVYISASVWRTLHPSATVVPTLPPGMRGPFWFCVLAFQLLFLTLLTVRVHVEGLHHELDRLYLEEDEEEEGRSVLRQPVLTSNV